MGIANRLQANFANGEISRKAMSREDIDVYYRSLAKCRNFVPQFQGGFAFRPPLEWMGTTKMVTSPSVFVDFTFRDTQAYVLELYIDGSDDLAIRFWKEDGALVYTVTDTGWVINHAADPNDSVDVGYPQGVGADPLDVTAGAADAEVILTIAGSYSFSDLQGLQYSQNGDMLVITNRDKMMLQIWRGSSSETAWAANLPTVVTDTKDYEFSAVANAGGYARFRVTNAAGQFAVGDSIDVHDSAYHNKRHTVTVVADVGGDRDLTTDTDYIDDDDGKVHLGGHLHSFIFYLDDEFPIFDLAEVIYPEALGFNEGRLYFGRDDLLWGSQAITEGRFGLVTFGIFDDPLATDSFFFALSISSRSVDLIRWFMSTDQGLYVGLENNISPITGDTKDEPIHATSVRVSGGSNIGCASAMAVSDGSDIMFIDSSRSKIYTHKFDLLADSQKATDLTVLADHLPDDTQKLVFQRGNPDVMWALNADGDIFGCAYYSAENIYGWFSVDFGLTEGNIEDIIATPVSNGKERLWVVYSEEIWSGSAYVTTYFIAQLKLPDKFIDRQDFFTDDKTEDIRTYGNAMNELQKDAIHMDMWVKRNGFGITEDADLYLLAHEAAGVITHVSVSTDGTLANIVTGTGATALLNGEDGRRTVIKASERGLGEGTFLLDTYASGTGKSTVDVLIGIEDYTLSSEDTYVIAPGSWGITADLITAATSSYTLGHLRTTSDSDIPVDVIADGGYVGELNMTINGSNYEVDLGTQEGVVVYIGKRYLGFAETLNLEVGGRSGPAFGKLQQVDEVGVGFLHSSGVQLGSDPYDLGEIIMRSTADLTDRPVPLYTGIRSIQGFPDASERQKHLFVIQQIPLPCTVTGLDITGDTADE